MQLDGGGAFLGGAIPFLFDLQSPVIRPARGASMLAAGRHLADRSGPAPFCMLAVPAFRSSLPVLGRPAQSEAFTPRDC